MSTVRAKRISPRKILVASVGVASLSYVVACERQQVTSGNLMARPPDAVDAAGPAPTDRAPPRDISVSGNLMAPEPFDAGAKPAPCDPPFVIGPDGRKKYKPECLK
ncbi:MAG: hypothetical protein U0235_19905 [Polyangiaceae bacterium]